MEETIVVVFEDEECAKHIPKSDLPEIPARTIEISAALRKHIKENIEYRRPNPVEFSDFETFHKKEYVDYVRGQLELCNDDKPKLLLGNSDLFISKGSNLAMRLAAGAIRDAVKLVFESETIRRVFCNVRPPGHHAKCQGGAGFCIFNNVWFGAEIARELLISKGNHSPRIAIIDWDVHHGDGTQDYVLKNTEKFTFFCSIHQTYNTNYPGTGKECVKYRKNSIIVNHNIKPESNDDFVKSYFDSWLIPELKSWKPDLILISCGFDGHTLDPIGQLCYSSELYGWMTSRLVQVAKHSCEGRIVSILEGGYNLQALRESAVCHVNALIDKL